MLFRSQYGDDIRECYSLRRQNKIICGKGFNNLSRWCNESNEPNVGLMKRALWTIRDVEDGEELVLKYPKHYPRSYLHRAESNRVESYSLE